MKEWFSAQELIAFDGLPNSIKGILKKSLNEKWEHQQRSGRGGGKEFHISSLPADAQRAIRISQAKKAASEASANPVLAGVKALEEEQQANREASFSRYQKLPKHCQQRVDNKLAILQAAKEFYSHSGLSKSKAYVAFCEAYNAGDISVDDAAIAQEKTCSRGTLFRWEKAVREQGIDALGGDTGKGKRGTGLIDTQPEVKEIVLALLVDFPHIKMSVLNKALQAKFYGASVTLPSVRTLSRWVDVWKEDNKALFSAVTNPDEWKNKYMDAQGSASEHVIALNQLWELDSTPADLMLTDGRYSIIGVIDVFSRRTYFLVNKTSDSKGVAKTIRHALLNWGVPEVAKTDNGADYKSQWIKGIFRSLDIEQEFCPPFQGWKKPHIERVFKTFSHDIAEILQGFIGHNVAERSAIEARKSFSDRLFKKDELIEVSLSSEELQAFCNQWLDFEYHTRTHSDLKCSPNEKVRNWPKAIRSISNERALDVLLSEPAGTRTIGKKGIKLFGNLYNHAELAAHTGEQVATFYDDADIGRIYVYDLNGEYICMAEDPEVTGISRTELAIEAKRVQKEAIQEERRRLKATAKKHSNREVAIEYLANKEREALEEKVTHFPRPSVEHTSQGLEAAAQAADTGKADNIRLDAEEEDAIFDELFPERNQAPAQIIKPEFKRTLNVPEKDIDRYEMWLQIGDSISHGTATQEEEKWHKNFRNSVSWSVGEEMYELRASYTNNELSK